MSRTPSLRELAQMVMGLQDELAEAREVIAAQAVTIAEQAAELARLRRKDGTDSSNSGLPPSKDKPGAGVRKQVTSSRERSGKKRGAQSGHEGRHLERSKAVDRMVEHRPSSCGGCRELLGPEAPVAGRPVVRQVHDLPTPRVEVVDHVLHSVACGCGHVTRAQVTGVTGPVQYSPRLVAAAAYLQVAQMVPVARSVQTLADLCGVRVSAGFVAAAVTRTAAKVKGANKAIAAKIADHTGAAYFDESATRIAGSEAWFHVAATQEWTSYHACSAGRKIASMVAAGILPVFGGTAVHDGLTSYFNDEVTPQARAHQLCWAHLERALKAVDLFDEAAHRDRWAADLRALMSDATRWRETGLAAGHTTMIEHKRQEITDRWEAIVTHAENVHPHRPGPGDQTEARRLVARLRQPSWLTFLADLRVQPWNNVAERAVRMIKTKTKVSGGFTTLTGLQRFLAVRGYLDTLRKNQRNVAIQPLGL